MAQISKAIAAFLSSAIALLVSFGLISPQLAEVLTPEQIAVAVGFIVSLITAAGVYLAPANKGKSDV